MAQSGSKGIYGALAVFVVLGAIVAYLIAAFYEPGPGPFEVEPAMWGLTLGFAVNSLVLIALLLTLRSVLSRLGSLESQPAGPEAIPKSEEKEHVIIIEGIGEAYASRLHQHGIITVPQLLRADPASVAAKIDVTPDVVRDWQAMGLLMKVKGIGPQFAEILVLAGVKTVQELAQSDPKVLIKKIDALEAKAGKRIAGVDVQEGHVKRMVQSAKDYLKSLRL